MHKSKPGYEKARELAMKKEEEERLVRKLLAGDLSHRQDNGDAMKFLKEAQKKNEEGLLLTSNESTSTLALSKVLGRAAVDKPTSVALSAAVELEKTRRKVLDGIVLAMDSKKKIKDRAVRSEADKDKADEEYYFQYEKLHELRDELAAARREISHEKYGANAQLIAQLLNQQPSTGDDIQLGDVETYNTVEKMLKGLLIRRSNTEEDLESTDSPAFLHLLKHKLIDAREQIQELRRKLSELNEALKIASLESKSALSLLAERNEDVEKQRSTITVLQLQLKNFKNRAAMSASPSSGGGGDGSNAGTGKEDIMSDLDQLRQEYQDLAQVNLVLEKQLKLMRIRSAFAHTGAGGSGADHGANAGHAKDPTMRRSLSQGHRKQSNASAVAHISLDDEIPTTKILMGMIEARRRHQARLAKSEVNAMAAWDYDAGAAHRVDPFAAREAARKLNMGAYSEPAAHPYIPPSRLARSNSMARTEADSRSRGEEPEAHHTPMAAQGASSDYTSAVGSPRVRSSELRASSPPPVAPAQSQVPRTSKAWVVLRQKLINFVGVTRADALRREEAHIKKLRKHVALLGSELQATTGERDNLAERTARLEQEIAMLRENAAATALRTERLLSQGGGGNNDSAPSSAQGSRLQTADPNTWRSDEQRVAAIRSDINMRSAAHDDTGPKADVDSQIENIVAIFTNQISSLRAELQQREAQIRDLTAEGEAHTVSVAAAHLSPPSKSLTLPHHANPFESHHTPQDVTLTRLEREVLRKDKQLIDQAQEVRVRDLRLKIAQDIAVEHRAVVNLGLTERAAARVVPRIRDWVGSVRDRMYMDGRGTGGITSQMSNSTDQFRSAQMLAIHDEEMREEERSLLNQMLSLSTNPTVLDHVTLQINRLRLDDVNPFEGSIAPVGDALSRNDRQWAHMRRLWLRLLTVREQAWQDCGDAGQRKRLEEKLVETYAAFLKFEQLDMGETRPSFACEGAMRSVSFASAPLTNEIVGEHEVYREYTALKELVKTRAAQQLQLEAQRDEIYAQLQRLQQNKKSVSVVAPQSALYILHEVAPGETSVVVAARYSITNLNLIRQTFSHAPRDTNAKPEAIYAPLQSLSALDAATPENGEEPTLVVRHLVGPHDSVNSIATQYGVPTSQVCRCGTLTALAPGDFVGVVDVLVSRRVAVLLVQAPQPENPLIQAHATVLARLPKPILPLVASRTFNVGIGDIHLYNEPLQPGVTVRVPLVFSQSLISMLPELLDSGCVAVMHESSPGETLADVAKKYGAPLSCLKTGESVAGAAAVMVPLSDFVSLTDFVFDDATAVAIEQVASRGNQAASQAFSFDTPLTKLMCSHVQGGIANDKVAAGDLARVGSIRHKHVDVAAGQAAAAAASTATASVTSPVSAAMVHDLAFKPPDVRLIEHKVVSSERLEAVAKKYSILREDIMVPNFTLLDSASAMWAVRLRSTKAIQKTREFGADLHCVVNLVDESVVSLAESVGVSVEAIRNVNSELHMDSASTSTPITGRVRVPVVTPKTEVLALKRSGEFYATVNAINLTAESVALQLDSSITDVQAFDVLLLPGITPIVKIDCTAAFATEHRLVVSFPIAGVNFGQLSVEVLSRLRSRIERDLMELLAYAKTAQTPGEIELVQVASVDDTEVVTVVITVTSLALLDAVEKVVREDGPTENLETAADFLRSDCKVTGLHKLSLNAYDIKRHHFRAKWTDCHVAAVKGSDTLAAVALRTKIGVEDLLAFNPNLMHVIYANTELDGEAESLEGIAYLRVPGSRDQRVTIRKNDSIRAVAERVQTTPASLKRFNVELLPLLLCVDSIRIPLHSVDMVGGDFITIRSHGAESESLLALATRHGVQLDDIRVSQFDIILGTVLRINPTCGVAMRGGRFLVTHPARDHRCETGETLEDIAEQYGVLVDELKFANASRLRIPPRSCVGLRSVPTSGSVLETGRSTIVRHKVLDGETAASIAGRYFQPITSLLGMNPQLYDLSDAHRIFVPIASVEADDVLTSQTSNIFTIIAPGQYDTLPSIARKFMVNQDRITDINQLLADPKRLIVPIASPMAATIARQKHLPLYVGIELHRDETLVSVADRYGVAVKDMLVLGKPLKPMGVTELDVPVSFDVAAQVVRMVQHSSNPEDPKVFYRTLPLSTESIQSVTKDFALTAEHDATLTPTGLIEVPLLVADALEIVRRREATLAKQRNELAQQALNITQSLRQLGERNEATKRELAKVEALRAKFGAEYLHQGPKYNTESTACQTDEVGAAEAAVGAVDINTPPITSPPNGPATGTVTSPATDGRSKILDHYAAVHHTTANHLQPHAGGNVQISAVAQPRAPRRNGATQTKLLSEQLGALEEAASSATTKVRLLEVKADEASRERNIARSRVEEVEHEMAEMQAKMAVLSEDLRTREANIAKLEQQIKYHRDAASAMREMPKILPASSAQRKKAPQSADPNERSGTGAAEQSTKSDDASLDQSLVMGLKLVDTSTSPLPGSLNPAAGAAAAAAGETQTADEATHTSRPVTVEAECQTMTNFDDLTTFAPMPLKPRRGHSAMGTPNPLNESPQHTPSVQPLSSEGLSLSPSHQPRTVVEDFEGERQSLVNEYEAYIQAQRARSLSLFQASVRGVRENVADLKMDVKKIFQKLMADIRTSTVDADLTLRTFARKEQQRATAGATVMAKVVAGPSASVARPTPAAHAADGKAGPARAQPPAAATDARKAPPMEPKAVADVMIKAAEDKRPDDELNSEDWMKKHISAAVLSDIASQSSAGRGTPGGTATVVPAAPATARPTPPQSSLPLIRTAPRTPPAESVPMRGNVVTKILGGTPPAQSVKVPARPMSDTSSDVSYSSKPEPLRDLMRISHDRRHPGPHASPTALAAVALAPPRQPTPPQEKTADPSPRNVERLDTPPAGADQYSKMQQDVAALVSYAAQQNDRMLEWQRQVAAGGQPPVGFESDAASVLSQASSGLPPTVEDLAPMVALIERLNDPEHPMSVEQKTAVDDARKRDRALRREAVALRYKAMQTRLELLKIEQRIFDVADGKEREGLMRIAGMWKRWLDKWNKRRRNIVVEQRANLQHLVAMFVLSQEDYAQMMDDEQVRSVQHSTTIGKAVPLYGASRPTVKGGLLVVRPHRPGSKWLPLQPPEEYPAQGSSKHFMPNFTTSTAPTARTS